MAKTNILPIVGAAAAMYFIMKRGGGSLEAGVASITHSMGGIARDIKHDLVHGDLLVAPKTIKFKKPGDTLKVTDAKPDWVYNTASNNFDNNAQASMVEIFHDKGTNTLYVTSLVNDGIFRAGGPDGYIDIVGQAPGDAEPKQLARLNG
jgi:hypothetical protein